MSATASSIFPPPPSSPKRRRSILPQKTDLVLVAVDAEALGLSLVWERSRGGEFFPHLYAPLPLKAVRWTQPLPDAVDGRRAMPELPA